MRKLAILLMFTGCAGSQAPTVKKAHRVDQTAATLAGHRCTTATTCRCRDAGLASDRVEKNAPAGDNKRFEFRVSSVSGQVWVTVDGQHKLYKNRERYEDCFYLDLGPGQHSVAIAGKADPSEPGVGLGLHVSEYRAKGKRKAKGGEKAGEAYELAWYDSFIMSCGVPGTCSRDQLVDWQDQIGGDRRLLRDHCGSSKVENLRWGTGRLPDGIHPEEIELSFELKIYPFVPRHLPRAAACNKKR